MFRLRRKAGSRRFFSPVKEEFKQAFADVVIIPLAAFSRCRYLDMLRVVDIRINLHGGAVVPGVFQGIPFSVIQTDFQRRAAAVNQAVEVPAVLTVKKCGHQQVGGQFPGQVPVPEGHILAGVISESGSVIRIIRLQLHAHIQVVQLPGGKLVG